MKRLVAIILCVLMGMKAGAEETDSLLVVFWNLENLFDPYADNGGEDFSSTGTRHWSKHKFRTKISAIGKTILWVGSSAGRLPDVVGFAEVENDYVLKSLTGSDVLKKAGYRFIHFDSPDPRGIDVALLYRKNVFRPLKAYPVTVLGNDGKPLGTRDILVAELLHQESGKTYDFIVNHHPSKYSGASVSDSKRRVVMERLAALCDSLGSAVVAMGDFNDTPDDKNFRILDGSMKNKAWDAFHKGKGTIKFDGKWDLIDMFFVSPDLSGNTEMSILYPPFLLVPDKTHGGLKPMRTYVGVKYNGGVSDHLPVRLLIESK